MGGHEAGHGAQEVPPNSSEVYEVYHQILREVYADAYSYMLMTNFPDESILRKEEVSVGISFAIAMQLHAIDQFKKRMGEGSKDPYNDPYPFAGALAINTFLNGGVLSNRNGRYFVNDLNEFSKATITYLRRINRVVNSLDKSRAEDFILEGTKTPELFLPNAA